MAVEARDSADESWAWRRGGLGWGQCPAASWGAGSARLLLGDCCQACLSGSVEAFQSAMCPIEEEREMYPAA